MVKPVGSMIGGGGAGGAEARAIADSQYSRAEEAPAFGSQYSMMPSSISSSVNDASASPGVPLRSWNIA